MIAANEVGEGRAFETEDNCLLVLWDGGQRELPCAPKSTLARSLVALIAERYRDTGTKPHAKPADVRAL
jgi:phosphopantothenoylcysteine decarboxylase/phosphopantothenate--cysteine ligase